MVNKGKGKAQIAPKCPVQRKTGPGPSKAMVASVRASRVKPAPAKAVRAAPATAVRRIPLSVNTIGDEEVQAVLAVLKSGMVTQGARVAEFEAALHQLTGAGPTRSATMLNSGSSANFLAAALLRQRTQDSRNFRNEVITPIVTWATTVAPLIQFGFKPVFVDVGPDYCIDPKAADRAVTDRTVAIAPVHLLGNPCDMDSIMRTANRYGLHVLEDCCEALGVSWNDRHVGTFGLTGSYSGYFSHHFTAIEAGILLHSNGDHAVRAWREHGWIRDYPTGVKNEIVGRHPDLDPRWIFDKLGWNLRSTELNAAIGLVQLMKASAWKRERVATAKALDARLRHDAFEPRFIHPKGNASPFSYPIMVKPETGFTAFELRAHLESCGVETRPVMTGLVTRHPWFQRHPDAYRVSGDVAHATSVHERALLVPCRPSMDGADVDHVAASIDAFLRAKGFNGLP